MNLLIGRIIILAPAVLIACFYAKKQNLYLVLAGLAYILLVVRVLTVIDKDDTQISKAENITTDFVYCIDLDSTKTRDDVASCYKLMQSDKALYDREYK